MVPTGFDHIAELRNSGRVEDAIQQSQLVLAKSTDPNERASLLTGIVVFYCTLGRLKEARQMLCQLQQMNISDLEVRLNAEFCEPCLLIQENKYAEGVSVFAAMLQRHSDSLKEARFRYLYEDIQLRRALGLFRLSHFKEALPILKEAASFSFDNATSEQQVHFALGVCLEETNDAAAAKQEFVRVASFGLKNEVEERALYRLAKLHYASGALAQARYQLEVILRDFPHSCSAVPRRYVYETLSRTCHYLGDKANANLYADLAKRE